MDDDWRIDTARWPGPEYNPLADINRIFIQVGRAYGMAFKEIIKMAEAFQRAYPLAPIVMHGSQDETATPDERKEEALRWASQRRSYPTSKPRWSRRR